MFTDILISLIGSGRRPLPHGAAVWRGNLAGPKAISRSSELAKAHAPDNHNHPLFNGARTSQKQKRHIDVSQA